MPELERLTEPVAMIDLDKMLDSLPKAIPFEPDPYGVTVYHAHVKTLTEHTEWVLIEHITIIEEAGGIGKQATLEQLLFREGTRHMDVIARTTRGPVRVQVLEIREAGTLNKEKPPQKNSLPVPKPKKQ